MHQEKPNKKPYWLNKNKKKHEKSWEDLASRGYRNKKSTLREKDRTEV